MPEIIVSDTSCIILLDKIDRINLLQSIFGTITITQTIADEFGQDIPDFFEIQNPKNKKYQKILESFLDPGESSAIALALENDECLLIIDELKGRREAKLLGINFTGTVGILIVAKEKGLIGSIADIFNEIEETDFRISEAVIKEAKLKCGE